MSQIKPIRVIKFSSEDDMFPASNLEYDYNDYSWKCKNVPDEEVFVDFDLGKVVTVTKVEIGNCGSAFVEIQFLDDSCSKFRPLLLSTPLMSTRECNSDDPGYKVRVFNETNFSGRRRPSRFLRVICSQPFRRHTSFGLSLVRVFGSELHEESKIVSDYPLEILPCKTENKIATLEQTTGDTESHKLVCDPVIENEPKKEPFDIEPTSVTTTHNTEIKSEFSAKINEVNEIISVPLEAEKTISSTFGFAPTKIVKEESSSSSDKILTGVTFALSGYQNPTRGELRDRGLSLGAKYRPAWGPGCTHLICAFPNTAKFREVRGNGIIVSEHWLIDCYDQKTHLPWREYRLEGAVSPVASLKRTISEDALTEENTKKKTKKAIYQECDTDDEIEDAVREMEEDSTGHLGIPSLPSIFSDMKYLFYGEFERAERQFLKRLVIAFGGAVSEYMNEEVRYVVTRSEWDNAFDEALADNRFLRFVRPEWLYKCDSQRRLCPLEGFEILRV